MSISLSFFVLCVSCCCCVCFQLSDAAPLAFQRKGWTFLEGIASDVIGDLRDAVLRAHLLEERAFLADSFRRFGCAEQERRLADGQMHLTASGETTNVTAEMGLFGGTSTSITCFVSSCVRSATRHGMARHSIERICQSAPRRCLAAAIVAVRQRRTTAVANRERAFLHRCTVFQGSANKWHQLSNTVAQYERTGIARLAFCSIFLLSTNQWIWPLFRWIRRRLSPSGVHCLT